MHKLYFDWYALHIIGKPQKKGAYLDESFAKRFSHIIALFVQQVQTLHNA